jgi:hypothetical protein
MDWLCKNSYAFVFDHEKGQGFVRLSDSYRNLEPFDLRKAIDDAMKWKDGSNL